MTEPVEKFLDVSPLDQNPNIPLPPPDGACPFTNLPHDPIDNIFGQLTNDVQRKMRLELVCKRFKSRIVQRVCWQLDDELVIGGESEPGNCQSTSFRINGRKFSLQKAPGALEILLKRITVRNLVIKHLELNQPFVESICATIGRHIKSIALRSVKLGTFHKGLLNLENLHSLAGSLISCDLSSVNNIRWESEGEYSQSILPVLECCKNVSNFYFRTCYTIGNDEVRQLMDSLKNCTKLESFTFETETDQYYNTYVQIFKLVNSLKHLKFLNANLFFDFPLPMFHKFLSEEVRSKIIQLSFNIVNYGRYPDAVARNIPLLFPNLKELVLHGRYDCDMVFSYVSNMFDSSSGQQIGKLTMKIENDEKEKCLLRLVDKNVAISIEGNVIRCMKNGVSVIIDI